MKKIKWILKPSNKAQGSGIFIINKLSQIKKWVNHTKHISNNNNKDESSNNNGNNYVISPYIESTIVGWWT